MFITFDKIETTAYIISWLIVLFISDLRANVFLEHFISHRERPQCMTNEVKRND